MPLRPACDCPAHNVGEREQQKVVKVGRGQWQEEKAAVTGDAHHGHPSKPAETSPGATPPYCPVEASPASSSAQSW